MRTTCDHCHQDYYRDELRAYCTTLQVQRIDMLCVKCIAEFEADRVGFVLGRPKVVPHALPR